MKPISIAENRDCREALPTFEDKFFDLAIVDPPYGGGQHFNFRYGTGDEVYENVAPPKEYFDELFKVSKDQIVWGGNYFTYALPVSRCWLSWYKSQPIDSFSDFELAWTSFDMVSKQINLESYGFRHADKRSGDKTIHPTQKPVSLYRYLLESFAKPGYKILDTHLGSQSSRIAAYKLGFDFWGYEIDVKHFSNGNKRFLNRISQSEINFYG